MWNYNLLKKKKIVKSYYIKEEEKYWIMKVINCENIKKREKKCKIHSCELTQLIKGNIVKMQNYSKEQYLCSKYSYNLVQSNIVYFCIKVDFSPYPTINGNWNVPEWCKKNA